MTAAGTRLYDRVRVRNMAQRVKADDEHDAAWLADILAIENEAASLRSTSRDSEDEALYASTRRAVESLLPERLPDEIGVGTWPGGGGRVSAYDNATWINDSGGAWVLLYAPQQFYDGLRILDRSSEATPTQAVTDLFASFDAVARSSEAAPTPEATVRGAVRRGLDEFGEAFDMLRENPTQNLPASEAAPVVGLSEAERIAIRIEVETEAMQTVARIVHAAGGEVRVPDLYDKLDWSVTRDPVDNATVWRARLTQTRTLGEAE